MNNKQSSRWKFTQSLEHFPVLSPTLITYKKMHSMLNLFDTHMRKLNH